VVIKDNIMEQELKNIAESDKEQDSRRANPGDVVSVEYKDWDLRFILNDGSVHIFIIAPGALLNMLSDPKNFTKDAIVWGDTCL
jgi:hypothetical protein